MKKILLICLLMIGLSACVTSMVNGPAPKESTIIFEPNNYNEFVYHDELFKPTKEEVTFNSDIDGDGELILIDSKNNIITTYLTSGISVKLKSDSQNTYKIGLRAQDNNVLIAYDSLEKTGGINEVLEYQLIDNLKVDDNLDKTKLIRFNNDLYAYSKDNDYLMIEYELPPKVVVTINNVISDNFIPMNNLETNVEEYLNLDIGIMEDEDDIIFLMTKDKFLRFEEVDDVYKDNNVISQIYPPFSIKYLSEDDIDKIEDFLEDFNPNEYQKVDEILEGDIVEIKLEDFVNPITILGNYITIDNITYIINDTVLNTLEDKYFKGK